MFSFGKKFFQGGMNLELTRRRRAWELNSVVVDAKYGPVQMEFKLASLLGITDRVGWICGNSGRL